MNKDGKILLHITPANIQK